MPPNIIDAYATVSLPGSGTTWVDQPPAVAPPGTGTDTVLQIFVPAENTLIDYGAGATPGIRMATDHHVDLTARTPLTTISLGAPGGPGASATAGVNVVTAGGKHEYIEGNTSESYGDSQLIYRCAKNEKVVGIWTENGDNAKTEIVAGTVTQTFNSEHNLTVGKPADYQYKGPKTEGIGTGGGGDYTLSVNGNKTETIKRDLNVTVIGKSKLTQNGDMGTVVNGVKTDVNIDNHTTVSAGNKMDAFRGIQTSINGGVQITQNTSLSIALNETISMTQNLVTLSTALYNKSSEATKVIDSIIAIFK